MPFDSQGNFSRVHNWEQDRINGIKIVSDRHDQEDDNFANGFDLCLVRDGRAAMTGNLKMGNFQIKNVANGSSSTDAVNKSQLDSLQTTLQAYADAIIPKGVIIPYGGSTAPSGFLFCDGSAVSRTTYADLFAVIGTTYGAGDGSTTFNLPNSENIVNSINTNVPVKGNGKCLGITDGTLNGTLEQIYGTNIQALMSHKNKQGVAVGTNLGTFSASNIFTSELAIGVSTDASKSGLVGTVTRTILTCKHIIKY